MGFPLPLAVPDSVDNACAVVEKDWKAIRKHMAKDKFLTDREREFLDICIKACQAASLVYAAAEILDSSEMNESALEKQNRPYGSTVAPLAYHLEQAVFALQSN